jgi:hypothetical protein
MRAGLLRPGAGQAAVFQIDNWPCHSVGGQRRDWAKVDALCSGTLFATARLRPTYQAGNEVRKSLDLYAACHVLAASRSHPLADFQTTEGAFPGTATRRERLRPRGSHGCNLLS